MRQPAQVPRIRLKKLPLWGARQVAPQEINFEWPTQEMIERMDPDVKLFLLDFRGNYAISSIKCTLTNG